MIGYPQPNITEQSAPGPLAVEGAINGQVTLSATPRRATKVTGILPAYTEFAAIKEQVLRMVVAEITPVG